MVAKASRSDWAKPLNAKITIVVPFPVKPSRARPAALYVVSRAAGVSPRSGTSNGRMSGRDS
jgi:hypothetical protein